MKSARAEALRLILPLALRLATHGGVGKITDRLHLVNVDFLGTDELRERVEDDESEEWEDSAHPSWCPG
jgi:hypothetical protein